MHCAPSSPITWGNHKSKHQMSGRLKVLLFHLAQFYLFPKFHIPLCFNAFHNDLIRALYTVPKRASHEANCLFIPLKYISLRPAKLHKALPALPSDIPKPISHALTATHHSIFPTPRTSSSYQPATQELVEHKWGHSTALASSGEPLTGPHVKPGSDCSLLYYPQHISVRISSATPSSLPLPNS